MRKKPLNSAIRPRQFGGFLKDSDFYYKKRFTRNRRFRYDESFHYFSPPYLIAPPRSIKKRFWSRFFTFETQTRLVGLGLSLGALLFNLVFPSRIYASKDYPLVAESQSVVAALDDRVQEAQLIAIKTVNYKNGGFGISARPLSETLSAEQIDDLLSSSQLATEEKSLRALANKAAANSAELKKVVQQLQAAIKEMPVVVDESASVFLCAVEPFENYTSNRLIPVLTMSGNFKINQFKAQPLPSFGVHSGRTVLVNTHQSNSNEHIFALAQILNVMGGELFDIDIILTQSPLTRWGVNLATFVVKGYDQLTRNMGNFSNCDPFSFAERRVANDMNYIRFVQEQGNRSLVEENVFHCTMQDFAKEIQVKNRDILVFFVLDQQLDRAGPLAAPALQHVREITKSLIYRRDAIVHVRNYVTDIFKSVNANINEIP